MVSGLDGPFIFIFEPLLRFGTVPVIFKNGDRQRLPSWALICAPLESSDFEQGVQLRSARGCAPIDTRDCDARAAAGLPAAY